VRPVITLDQAGSSVERATDAGLELASSSPAVPPTCPKQRFTAVANEEQRSAAAAPDLHQRPSIGGITVLPKLAVVRA
jgi:hypothetical protein